MKEYNGLGLTRRRLLAATMTCALLGRAQRAFALPGTELQTWIDQQQELADALATGQIQPTAWCEEVEGLARQVNLPALLAAAKASAEEAKQGEAGNDPQKRVVRFIDASGKPQRLGFGVALIDFQPQNVITPRGHRNMVSAHLVLEGKVRIRTFDRVRDDKNAMVIKPAGDVVAGPGQISTMCSERHNVHWLVPQDGPATTLQIVIDGLSSKGARSEVIALDPIGGRVLKDGSIVAPVMSLDAAGAKYTSEL